MAGAKIAEHMQTTKMARKIRNRGQPRAIMTSQMMSSNTLMKILDIYGIMTNFPHRAHP